MSGWELTAGLQNLRNQMNTRFPHRDKTSDGTIGDAAHQDRTSGHNPDDTPGSKPAWNGDPDTKPEVRAWDMDDDLGESGTSAQMVVDHLRKLSGLSNVVRYMIYNETMYHSRTGFAPEPGDGHTEHIHFEGAWTQSGDTNTTFDFKLDQVGDGMDIAEYYARIDLAVQGDPSATSTDREWRNRAARLGRFEQGLSLADQTTENLMPGQFAHVDAEIATVKAELAEIKAALASIVPASGMITQEQILALAAEIAADLAIRIATK